MALLHHCKFCNIDVLSNNLIEHSETERHKLLCEQEKSDDCAVYIVESAFKRRIVSYRINGSADILDPKLYLLSIGEKLEKVINIELETHKNVKINVELFGTFMKTNTEGEVIRDLKSFNTKNVVMHKDCMDFPFYFEQISMSISKKCEDFTERDSGWTLEKIEYLNVNINKYQPLKGSTYIPLPPEVQAKKACVNVKNSDDKCFFWAIISALYPIHKNSDRTSSYPHYTDILNVTGIKDPVCLSDIKKFEKLNKISVNVYGIDDDRNDRGLTIVPLRISKMSFDNHVNLLYFERGHISHYCWIKNLSRLVSSQISKHGKATWICDGCLHPFANKNKLDQHRTIGCGETLVELPEQNDKYLHFKNYKNKMKVPFVVYGDFESILVPLDSEKSTSATYNTHKHVPCSFSYYIHCDYDSNLSKFVIYRGEDCVQKFIKSLRKDADRIIEILQKVVPPKNNSGANTSSDVCHICKKKIGIGEAGRWRTGGRQLLSRLRQQAHRLRLQAHRLRLQSPAWRSTGALCPGGCTTLTGIETQIMCADDRYDSETEAPPRRAPPLYAHAHAHARDTQALIDTHACKGEAEERFAYGPGASAGATTLVPTLLPDHERLEPYKCVDGARGSDENAVSSSQSGHTHWDKIGKHTLWPYIRHLHGHKADKAAHTVG
ncbi:uncharacterized protein LOC134677251 [Cydia fagiglandana]|uniref:uncharacterized protein LOC134677251 n=1 Tax=Cydia fagiglandana TaxID=1458189 RepID=UPI002FEE48E4